jgi:TolB-like protein
VVRPTLSHPALRTTELADTLSRLGATHVLAGTVERSGNGVRIFVELVQLPSWRHVWADSLIDTSAFSGNSRVTAGRIVRAVAGALGAEAPPP